MRNLRAMVMPMVMPMVMLATALSLTACDDFVGPWGSSGTYDLLSANGEPVPAVLYSRGGANRYSVTLTGGELRLRDDDTFTLDLDYVEDDAGVQTRYTQGIAGEWSTENDTIWLDYVNPDTGDWTSLGATRRHGTLELTIPGAVAGTTVRTVFAR